MIITINSLEDLPNAALKLLEFAEGQKVFLFYGDMGAGKTTFIKSICKQLGVDDMVTSPTFSIVNEYDSPLGSIYHFDFYRLKTETEALDLGYENYLYSGNYCLIEWPENIASLLPEHVLTIDIQIISGLKRTLDVKHT